MAASEETIQRRNKPAGTKSDEDYAALCKIVGKIVKGSSHWEQYGYDQCIVASAFAMLPVGFYLLRFHGLAFLLGLYILGTVHVMVITKAAHSASHHALFATRKLNDYFGVFFTEICGAFTYYGAKDTHINIHHPYTNVVGLGDSSIWKAPFLGRTMYLFFAPHLLPFVAPFFSMQLLHGKWKPIAKNAVLMLFGFIGHFFCFKIFSGLSTVWSIICLCASRSMYYCPYIHVNVFQHIGLSFYHPDNRPKKLRLMATGALNLSRNFILDYCFGHALINCHVEHHLFPRLSDNMCLKIKPTVKEYLEENGLPYQEDSYWNRLKIFYNNYKELMVEAPPLTDFIGIQ